MTKTQRMADKASVSLHHGPVALGHVFCLCLALTHCWGSGLVLLGGADLSQHVRATSFYGHCRVAFCSKDGVRISTRD